MKFAKVVFRVAGIWGIVVLTPLFVLHDISGRAYPPPTDYPQFFYGFMAVTLAWQIVFLVIGSDPVRYRLLMFPSILEKLGFIVTVAILYSRARISAVDASAAAPDLVLMILFMIAAVKTPTTDWHLVASP